MEEGMVQGEDAGEVVEVGDERRPDCIFATVSGGPGFKGTEWRN